MRSGPTEPPLDVAYAEDAPSKRIDSGLQRVLRTGMETPVTSFRLPPALVESVRDTAKLSGYLNTSELVREGLSALVADDSRALEGVRARIEAHRAQMALDLKGNDGPP